MKDRNEYKFDLSKLKGKIKEVLGTQDKYAEELGLARTSVSARLSGKIEFSQSEIKKSCEILHIQPKDIPIYFFTCNV